MLEPETGFIPGLELSERFFRAAVKPLLDEAHRDFVYSAALIGAGSEVLGYDTERSTDHEWGPRLQIFVAAEAAGTIPELIEIFRQRLARTFLGYSTHFGPPDAEGVRLRGDAPDGPVEHKIEVVTIGDFFAALLGFDPRAGIELPDWLVTPEQSLLSVVAGRVFRDGLGDLNRIRSSLAYYPFDIWLFLLASQWQRISQQEAFVGRAGEVGDEIGSAAIAAVLVKDLMQLGFLLERRYAPYSKWFGTAFAKLDCAGELQPLFARVLGAETWQAREASLARAYETMARRFNALGIAPAVDPTARNYHSRPFRVLHAERVVAAIEPAIKSAEIRKLIERAGWIGGIDQITDNVDLKTSPPLARRLRSLYEPPA